MREDKNIRLVFNVIETGNFNRLLGHAGKTMNSHLQETGS